MENKEVWVVVLVLGFVLLMNNNGMTGNYGVRDSRTSPMVVENRQSSSSPTGSGYYYEPRDVRTVYNRPLGTGGLPYDRLDEEYGLNAGQPGRNVEFPAVSDEEARRRPGQGVETVRPTVFPKAGR